MKILFLIITASTVLFYSESKQKEKAYEFISEKTEESRELLKDYRKKTKTTLMNQLDKHRKDNPPKVETSRLSNNLCLVTETHKRPFGLGEYKVIKKERCNVQ